MITILGQTESVGFKLLIFTLSFVLCYDIVMIYTESFFLFYVIANTFYSITTKLTELLYYHLNNLKRFFLICLTCRFVCDYLYLIK